MLTALIIAAIAFVTYTYAGYPVILWLLTRRRRAPRMNPALTPQVTVVIAAFNEQDCIGTTIESVLASDYPAKELKVIVVSDASTDGTDKIVQSFPPQRVRLLRQKKRSGQTAGLIRGAQAASGNILIAADASGRFMRNTVRTLVRHFSDPTVGAVSGYNKVDNNGSAVAKGDSAYMRYDRTLRYWESKTGSSWVGCQGGIFAIRKPLFQVDFPLDMAADNALGYELYERGYKHHFDPEAIVLEKPPRDLTNEFQRKVRIIVLQLHGIRYFRRLFNPFRHFFFFFQNVSHKMCRWLAPFALIALAIASAVAPHAWTKALFALQALFYTLAVAGMLLGRRRKAPWFLSIPAYFVAVNAAGFMAWGMLFKNYTLWKPPARDMAAS